MEARTLTMEVRTLTTEARTLSLSAFVVRNSACTLTMEALVLRLSARDVSLQGLTMPFHAQLLGDVTCGALGRIYKQVRIRNQLERKGEMIMSTIPLTPGPAEVPANKYTPDAQDRMTRLRT